MKNHRLGAILGATAVAAIASLTIGMSAASAGDGIVGVVDVNGATNTAGNVGQVLNDPTSGVQNDTAADGHVCLSIFAPFPCGPNGQPGSGTDVEGTAATNGSAATDAAGDSLDVDANAALNAKANTDADATGANADASACGDGTTSESDESSGGPISGKTLSLTGMLGALAAGAVGIQRHRKKAGLV